MKKWYKFLYVSGQTPDINSYQIALNVVLTFILVGVLSGIIEGSTFFVFFAAGIAAGLNGPDVLAFIKRYRNTYQFRFDTGEQTFQTDNVEEARSFVKEHFPEFKQDYLSHHDRYQIFSITTNSKKPEETPDKNSVLVLWLEDRDGKMNAILGVFPDTPEGLKKMKDAKLDMMTYSGEVPEIEHAWNSISTRDHRRGVDRVESWHSEDFFLHLERWEI